ncbi:MAG: hypothetical protein HYR96_11210 [Deltaproteobacteria bacterium]|nr:hypothetical protein [Deltaproteobacteria bacterium]MBI3295969.1 hypothetical protein [Deltaproteobacteria bacterium]
MGGFGVASGNSGYVALVGFDSVPIKRLLPDFSNPAFLEFQGAGLISRNETQYPFHIHLRWHFISRDNWALYNFGGVGAVIRPSDSPLFSIRAGWGWLWYFGEFVALRLELSPDFYGAGLLVRGWD